MGINMYFTLYKCIKSRFRYQALIASMGIHNSVFQDKLDSFAKVIVPNSLRGIDTEIDATSDIVGMLICCN